MRTYRKRPPIVEAELFNNTVGQASRFGFKLKAGHVRAAEPTRVAKSTPGADDVLCSNGKPLGFSGVAGCCHDGYAPCGRILPDAGLEGLASWIRMGDMVVRNADGKLWPCEGGEFKSMYEEVSDG